MTRDEALQEAQRRWGVNGRAERDTWTRSKYGFQVGEIRKHLFHCRGTGDSWEAAFADADRKELEASK